MTRKALLLTNRYLDIVTRLCTTTFALHCIYAARYRCYFLLSSFYKLTYHFRQDDVVLAFAPDQPGLATMPSLRPQAYSLSDHRRPTHAPHRMQSWLLVDAPQTYPHATLHHIYPAHPRKIRRARRREGPVCHRWDRF